MDSEIIEADFQQYYNLELESLIRTNFPRYCRLLLQLPFEARFVQKYCKSKDWDWDKETQSRILHALDTISCQLSNMIKKKSEPLRKPDEQFQPDYVKKAKAEARRIGQEEAEVSQKEVKDMQIFWESYNNRVRKSDDGD